MIILCEKCRTKFQINEELLSHEGSRVRCSLCKHVFVAYPLNLRGNEEQKDKAENHVWPDIKEQVFEPQDKEVLESDTDFMEDSMEDISKLELEYEKSHGLAEGNADMGKASPRYEMEGEGIPAETERPSPLFSGKKTAPRSLAPLFILLSFLALIVAAALVYIYAPHLIPSFLPGATGLSEIKKGSDSGTSRLEIVSVESSFVDSKMAGRLFVVRGKVTNRYPEERSFIFVKGSVLDDKGQVVKEESVYAGNTFTNEELIIMPFEKISQAVNNRRGADDNNVNIKPGEAVNFMIVFEKLPANLNEFTVGAVSSLPGNPGSGS
ncbi:conserved hypothetical protein [uncultured Desulfobacterium sp.]|uniref:Zinc finger/thioredoxin putative domain-containing protein n=1 Tax=uncultured Desulfobacterium sp. TaxID=201089 RepID=A0A445N334_9BACT|nr:conserved hypothetical protein [uncultured Desulfobacterium sp.]